jgi:hypothetical protein
MKFDRFDRFLWPDKTGVACVWMVSRTGAPVMSSCRKTCGWFAGQTSGSLLDVP